MQYNILDKELRTSFHNRLLYIFSQRAYTTDYEQCFARLDALYNEVGGPRVKDFVMDITFQHWCNSFFFRQRYGEMLSSVVET